uniref:JmjC domain-containing protein n=1 Tax=Moniliophthora roreri TaxID=221103 RepID=A0A0W0FT72_MONRR
MHYVPPSVSLPTIQRLITTIIRVLHGCKIVHILMPEDVDWSEAAELEFIRGLGLDRTNTVGWKVVSLVLQDGNFIIMPPMTVHYVTIVRFTMCFGSHFYCMSLPLNGLGLNNSVI